MQFYRRDIDGLRCIAVISVFLWHLNRNLLPGGFVGVDIFFVISGYLITGLLIRELLISGTIDIVGFYIRRVKRILPTLFAVMFLNIPIAYYLFDEKTFELFRVSFKFASIQLSNVFFSRQVGYFDLEGSKSPLMHTWSLGIEEQFYLLWPFFLMFIWRFWKNRILCLIWGILLISFLIGLTHYKYGDGRSAFFLLPGRFWELALGGSVYFFERYKNNIKLVFLHCLSNFGLLGIVYSLFFIRENEYPVIFAVIPCMSTMMLIISGGYFSHYPKSHTFLHKLLITKPVVFIGKISYSMYLIHFPILVYLNYLLIEPNISFHYGLVILCITILLAFLSFKYLETPFRYGSFLSINKYFYLTIKKINTKKNFFGIKIIYGFFEKK